MPTSIADTPTMSLARTVTYCKICTIPVEFCQYTASAERCKKQLAQDDPEMYRQIYEKESKSAEGAVASQEQVLSDEVAEKLNLESAPVEGENSEEKKHQSRGGKGLQRDEGAKLDKEALKRAKARLQLKRTDRNKRKAVTHIRGFELFGLDLKKVAKKLAGKYACGCSVVKDNNGKEEIDLQGDFVDDLLEYIPKEFPEINVKQIDVIEK